MLTHNGLGITIIGDYDDLNELYDAISQVCDLYFNTTTNTIINDYKKNKIDEKEKYEAMHDCVMGLCYDIRHAYQGERKVEYRGEFRILKNELSSFLFYR